MGVCGTVRVLIIDFYDSYTNSILQLLQGNRNSDDGTKHSEWSAAVVRFDQYTWYAREITSPTICADDLVGNILGRTYCPMLMQSFFHQAQEGQTGLVTSVLLRL